MGAELVSQKSVVEGAPPANPTDEKQPTSRDEKDETKLIQPKIEESEVKKEEEPVRVPEFKFRPNPESDGHRKFKSLASASAIALKLRNQIKSTVKKETRTF